MQKWKSSFWSSSSRSPTMSALRQLAAVRCVLFHPTEHFFTPLSTFSPYWALFTLLSTFHPTSTIHPTKHCRGKYFRNQGSKRELWLLLRWTPAHKKATELLKAGSYFIILSMMKADNMVSFSETFLSLQVVTWNLIQYYIGNIWN